MIVISLSLLMAAGSLAQSAGEGQLPAVVEYPAKLTKAFNLPRKVNETSGLIHFSEAFWTFNDSGGKPEIYKIDPEDGAIIQTVVLEGARNRDWEDMCQDETHIYLGDFGNNQGNRKDLRVYKIAKSSITEETLVTVPAETIFFSYTDQLNFTTRDRRHDHDCESMVSHGDRLLLFSKNWANGKSRMYSLSKEPGIHSISPVFEFDARGLVTGASLCAKNDQLVMVGYTNRVPFVYIFPGFDGTGLDTSTALRINFSQMPQVQTEGICFVEENKLAISAEQTMRHEPAVYLLDIGEMLTKPVKGK